MMMRPAWVFPLAWLGAALLCACGGSVADDKLGDSGPDVGSDGGIDTSSFPIDSAARDDSETILDGTPVDTHPAVDGGGACNDLARIGPLIEVVKVPATLPTLTGGTIALGTYVLVKEEQYTGPGGGSGKTGDTLNETLLIDATTIESIFSANGAGDVDETSSYTAAGNALHVVSACGSDGSVDFQYQATTTTLIFAVSVSSVNVLLTWEKK